MPEYFQAESEKGENTMYTIPPKKMIIMNILQILEKYTDENHRLSQKEICDILRDEYLMKIDRKTVKKNLMNLIDAGYHIEYSESVRLVKNKEGKLEETVVPTDFYISRSFTDGELRLLIDSLLFSKHIPHSQCMELIQKLEGLSSVYFQSRVRHVHTFSQGQADNKQLFYHIELLDEAISKKRQVSFQYLEYGTDKKMHCRKRPDGTVREYIINPYQMAAKDGRYYLICNYHKYDDISNYRLDRIQNLKILDTPVKPYETLMGADGKRLDLQKYMDEHVYMYSGGKVRTKFRITKSLISDVIDLFGKGIRFSDETQHHVVVTANVNEKAMKQFAHSYAPEVLILEPKRLADSVLADLRILVSEYGKTEVSP